MDNHKICPKCGSLVYYDSYFGGYICNSCSWEDTEAFRQRVKSDDGLMAKRLFELIKEV